MNKPKNLSGIKLLLPQRFNLSEQFGSLGNHLALLQRRNVEPRGGCIN